MHARALSSRRPHAMAMTRRTLLRLAGPVVVWGFFSLMLIPYSSLRALGDAHFHPYHLEGIEQALFGGFTPTRWMQESVYERDIVAIDYAGFIAHFSWFFLPFVWGVVVALTDRKKILEFYVWILMLSYLSTAIFLVAPTRPPWMEDDVSRILVDRSFVQYTQLDTNPFAAFPSMHAGLPMVMALFFFLRIPQKRGFAWMLGLHGAYVSLAIVYLGEHWVIDVLGGWLLAVGVAWLFTSDAVKSLAETIPGRPLLHLGRCNDWLMGLGSFPLENRESREPEAEILEGTERWAA